MRCFPSAASWWALPTGQLNSIEDVSGVRVGHATLRTDTARTGVTAVLPHSGDLFLTPVTAGAAILNGFGKSLGLVQLQELGEIETPVLLTNTFSVGPCANSLIRSAVRSNKTIGRGTRTVNPLVLECNDGRVNDIQSMAVTEDTARQALENALTNTDFQQGNIGAGTGMSSFGLAGGIGSASRKVQLEGNSSYVLGCLVLSNFGQPSELRVFGRRLTEFNHSEKHTDKGSIIILLATDAPLDSRQLTRLARRSSAALGRLGSFLGHQSGDIAIAFSTCLPKNRNTCSDTISVDRLLEDRLNPFFHSSVEVVEEAILNAMWYSQPIEGYDGNQFETLRERLNNTWLSAELRMLK